MGEDQRPIRISVAGPADAHGLAALAERSFREAWAGYNDPADMDTYCANYFCPELVRAEFDRLDVQYLLARADGELAGYLRTASGAAPACVRARSPVEISRVYVLQQWHGRGVAPALIGAGLDAALRNGHDVAWLAVWQRAEQALAFYRKWDFEVVGATTFRLGSDLQDDFVMQRSL
jgi:GNAT superfamily N-acetyltransferase